jgi:cytochrome c oxidase cbb3-type subunit IV
VIISHSIYETLRHLADSWGLLGMGVVFLLLCAWPFLPGNRDANEAAAKMIFAENDLGDDDHG